MNCIFLKYDTVLTVRHFLVEIYAIYCSTSVDGYFGGSELELRTLLYIITDVEAVPLQVK